jgi:hypothetical protein
LRNTFITDDLELAEGIELPEAEAEGAPVDRIDWIEKLWVELTTEVNDDLKDDPTEATDDTDATAEELLTPDEIEATDTDTTVPEDGAGEE